MTASTFGAAALPLLVIVDWLVASSLSPLPGYRWRERERGRERSESEGEVGLDERERQGRTSKRQGEARAPLLNELNGKAFTIIRHVLQEVCLGMEGTV